MGQLTKEQSLFKRDGEGKLLPVEIVLFGLPDKPTIIATPMTKGQLQELFSGVKDTKGETTKDQDNEIILKYCVAPKYTEDEVKVIRANMSDAIVSSIMGYSLGLSPSEFKNKTKKEAIDSVDQGSADAAKKDAPMM